MTSSQKSSDRLTWFQLWRPLLAMTLVIVVSNFAVQFPINDWLTWGAFTYPFVFLVADLTNRAVGAQAARRVAWLGLLPAVLLSAWLANWHIALASGTAFILSQWMDIAVFNRWRSQFLVEGAVHRVLWWPRWWIPWFFSRSPSTAAR